MRLFYAQSAEGKITITAPYRTFSSQATFDELRSVQPYMYTKNKERIHISNIQVSQINYYPKNNKHLEIEIVFAKEFNPEEGSLIYCNALFDSGYVITFALPFIKAGIITAQASTSAKTLSVSVPEKLSTPVTVYKTYASSQYLKTSAVTAESATFEIKDLYKNYQSIEFVGGVFNAVDSKTLIDSFEAGKGKFLESDEFVNNWKSQSLHFYIYSDNLSLDDFSKNGGGCLDALGDNYNSNAEYSDNSCVYTTRPPENITITTTVGNKNELPTVTYLESKLSADDYNDVANFDVTSYSVKGVADTTPTSKNLNIEDVYSTLRVEWTDAQASLGFDDLDAKPEYWYATLSVEENTFDTTERTFYPIVFKSSILGCLDNTAINYDSTATGPCKDCCVYCDKTQYGLNMTLSSEGTLTTNSDGILGNNGGQFLYEAVNIDGVLLNSISLTSQAIANYISELSSTVWTAKLYNASQILLNNQYEQANITGAALESLVNEGGSGGQVIFNYPGGGNLIVGNEYYLEIIFDNGSGCTFYKYILFNVPFDGCTDPSANNYNPAPFNTGLGNCTYNTDITCEESILASVSAPLILENNNAQYTITTLGVSEDGITPSSAISIMSITSLVDGSYTILQNSTAVSPLSTNTSISGILILEPNQTATIYVLNQLTGCFETFIITAPAPILIEGCTDVLALNYNENADIDNGSCVYCTDISFSVATTFSTTACDGLSTVEGGSAEFTVNNNVGDFTISLVGITGLIVPEYLSPMPVNSTSTGAVLPAGVYQATVEAVMGPGLICTDTVVFGIGSQDAQCGCTNPQAVNYDPNALYDDFSCIIEGCTNPLALNYNPEATSNVGCVFIDQFPTPLCIPDTVDNMVEYDVTLNNIKKCLSKEGTTLLFKIKGGIKCDPLEQVKLTLISYLLNKIGLECLYNCNYSYVDTDEQIDCAALWASGGPSGGNLNFSYTTEYLKGDIVKWRDNYYVSPGGLPAGTTPSSFNNWTLCVDKTIVTGSETYLETFINFARKFCTVCFSDQPQASIGTPAINANNALGDINLENGDNIEL